MSKQIVRKEPLAWAVSIALVLSVIFPVQANAAYITASNTYGTLFLNESNGKISFCGAVLSGTTVAGTCTQVGTISTTSLSGNAQINMFGSGSCVNLICGTNATVVNKATGVVVLCPAWRDQNGAAYATCSSAKQAP